MREGNLDPCGVEGLFEAAIELAADRPLPAWQGIEPHLDDDGRLLEAVEPDHLEWRQDEGPKGGIGLERIGRALEDGDHAVRVLTIGDRDVDDIKREIT